MAKFGRYDARNKKANRHGSYDKKIHDVGNRKPLRGNLRDIVVNAGLDKPEPEVDEFETTEMYTSDT